MLHHLDGHDRSYERDGRTFNRNYPGYCRIFVRESDDEQFRLVGEAEGVNEDFRKICSVDVRLFNFDRAQFRIETRADLPGVDCSYSYQGYETFGVEYLPVHTSPF